MPNINTMMPAVLAGIILPVAIVSSCTSTEDADKRIDELTERVASLEDQVGAVNDNTHAVKVLLTEGITIAGYDITSNGYTLTLSDGQVLEITFGSGLAGVVPVVGVDEDGDWIVSLDGGTTWEPVEGSTNSREGDGDVPLVQVDDYGYWCVSVDGGKTWSRLTGSDGRPVSANDGREVSGSYSFFQSVEYDDDTMRLRFYLNTGASFSVPVLGTYYIRLKYYEDGDRIFNGETLTFPVETEHIASAVWKTVPDGWRARFADEGMTFYAPEDGEAGEYSFELLAFSDEGYTKVYTYTLTYDPEYIFYDDFEREFDVDGHAAPDPKRWTLYAKGNSSTNQYMSQSYDNAYVEPSEGRMVISSGKDSDTGDYKTGGITTINRIIFGNARVEAKAFLVKNAQGAQNAIWLNTQSLSWPNGGEVDIMEHINKETTAYQTCHSVYTIYDSDQPQVGDPERDKWFAADKMPINQGTPSYDPSQYHVFGADVTDEGVIFHIDGKKTFTYPNMHWTTIADITSMSWKRYSEYYNLDRDDADIVDQLLKKDWAHQWPFQDSDWYIIIDITLGSPWSGSIIDSELPANMYIDWVKVTPLDRAAPLE